MLISDVIACLEEAMPLSWQEDWDNSGLQLGDVQREATGVLLCLDVVPQVLEEAVARGCNLVVAHHPLIFRPLKRIGTDSYIERCIAYAFEHRLCIYSAHTNADNAPLGINSMLAEKLGLLACQTLLPMDGQLLELKTFVPLAQKQQVLEALWQAGAGQQGLYDSCSFSSIGEGTFRAKPGANPYVGAIDELHHEEEAVLTLVLPRHKQRAVLAALMQAHPYEEVAYSIVPLLNKGGDVGTGVLGSLPQACGEEEYLQHLKSLFGLSSLTHSQLRGKAIERVAVVGGSGASFWRAAAAAKADLLLTGEAKYNDYYDAAEHLLLVCIGHYESEEIAKQLFHRIISQKFPNFAVHLSQQTSNPVNYL